MKVIFFTFFIFFTFSVSAQIDPVWYNLLIPHDKAETIKDMLEKEGVDLSIDTLPYLILDYKNDKFFLTKKTEKSNIRAFKILKTTADFYVVCSDNVDLCDCKANTFIYKKSNDKLQRIQRPFSFSLKRNIIKRLDDMELDKPEGYEDLSFCEILEGL
ncbi:hypothetical protein [Flavobacterium sp. CS20]|uniref:hypothetical protein n=1 Tax=Flavobacterium sp. CS20 TaxID=2775246 RepID=UPI001B3A5552|nr:hypothetical protein [Flavobacterium sp. CS20]QTY27885.1 hypothetical protein IGB25_05090 [Flavobacterium sp. CS20]